MKVGINRDTGEPITDEDYNSHEWVELDTELGMSYKKCLKCAATIGKLSQAVIYTSKFTKSAGNECYYSEKLVNERMIQDIVE